MADITPMTFRWGIISTGWIAECFVKDLLVDPKTRDVHDVVHKIVAVGSRSVDKAQEFIDRVIGGDKAIKAYGIYEEVYADADVDAIYIGTPHTHHYSSALSGLKGRKPVLCEKPVTSNLPELLSLISAAKENKTFFMEAMWTRFQPLSLQVKKVVDSGELGKPVLVHADLSGNFGIDNIPKTHRILDPNLGGGALLDLGPYPLFWAILALYEHPSNHSKFPTIITGNMLNTPITPVDSSTVFSLTFSAGDTSSPFQKAELVPNSLISLLSAQASLSCSITLNALPTGVSIRFEKGLITIPSPIYCPKEFTVSYYSVSSITDPATGKVTEKIGGKIVREEKRVFEYTGGGWHFQADEVARCVRDGKIQSDLWGWDKSILEMTVFDEVRKQGGYKFPEGVEKVL